MLGATFKNLQASWVKEGMVWARELLACGATDLGGTLINESISTSAGAGHGQLQSPRSLRDAIRVAGRNPVERTRATRSSVGSAATVPTIPKSRSTPSPIRWRPSVPTLGSRATRGIASTSSSSAAAALEPEEWAGEARDCAEARLRVPLSVSARGRARGSCSRTSTCRRTRHSSCRTRRSCAPSPCRASTRDRA